MREAAHGIELRTAATTEALAGTVRVSASVTVTLSHLPEIVAELRDLVRLALASRTPARCGRLAVLCDMR